MIDSALKLAAGFVLGVLATLIYMAFDVIREGLRSDR